MTQNILDLVKISTREELHGLNEGVKVGVYNISIQASEYHYCTPRISFDDIHGYSEVEVMIVPRLPITIENQYTEWLDSTYEKYSLIGYLPVANLQKLYETLLEELFK